MTNLVGIDCATEKAKLGLAFGELSNGSLVIHEARKLAGDENATEVIGDWIKPGSPALLAIDAPLGWLAALGDSLAAHASGQVIEQDKNHLFRRETDRYIKKVLGKQPLDVGADRIARTAHAALSILEELRKHTGQVIPLAWEGGPGPGISAIEVYPAGTLTACGLRATGYKKRENAAERREIISGLSRLASLECDISMLEADDDILDAAVCVLAGADFLAGRSMPPQDIALARKEGWIWVRPWRGV